MNTVWRLLASGAAIAIALPSPINAQQVAPTLQAVPGYTMPDTQSWE